MIATRIPSRLERAGGRVLTALPPQLARALIGQHRAGAGIASGHELDAQTALVLAMRNRRGVPPFDALTPAEARAFVRREARVGAGPPARVAEVSDLAVDGDTGPLRARHYRPFDADTHGGAGPLLVYVHGGGFVTCDLDTHDGVCRTLCRHAGVQVLSIRYRLAPEHPFPAAVEDVNAATRWAMQHATRLGADEQRVAIGGDSAGGNLAAVVSASLKDAGGRLPSAQLLIYPATDRAGSHDSMQQFADGCYLTAADVAWYHAQYVGTDRNHDADPHVSPLQRSDLTGLPPALVATAGFDPLRDEGEAYAAALRAAGVPVVGRRFPTLTHGFTGMTGLSQAASAAVVEVAGALRALLALTAA